MFSMGLVKAVVEGIIVNPLLSPLPPLEEGGRGGLLFNLAMTKVSVLNKEPECKMEKVKKLEVM